MIEHAFACARIMMDGRNCVCINDGKEKNSKMPKITMKKNETNERTAA